MSQASARPQLARRGGLAHLTAALNELRANGTHFKLRILDDQQAPVCHYDGKQVINLASNNYLGLANHPKLIEAALAATRTFGVGSGAVRTIAGTMRIHMDLEEKIARFKNVEACVVFQSGFTANAGTVSSILGKDDFILSDELNHASIIDGARLSRALFEEGVMGTGIAFPTVPEGKARIRLMLSSEHTRAQLDQALETLERVAKRLGILQ